MYNKCYLNQNIYIYIFICNTHSDKHGHEHSCEYVQRHENGYAHINLHEFEFEH